MSHSVGLRERGMASPQIYSQAPGRGLRISRNLRTALFLAPAALVVIVMVIAPIILNFVISLTDMGADLRVTRFSFDQYARMALLDTRIKSAAVLSLIVTVSVVSLNIMLALALSVTTTMVGQRTGAIYRTIWLLPRISPVVVYAMLWKLALSPTEQGGVNAILARIGVAPIAPLNDHALLVVILAGVGIGASLGMVLFTSTIRSIDQHLFYAASADGAGRFAQISACRASRAEATDRVPERFPISECSDGDRTHPSHHAWRPVLRHDSLSALCSVPRVQHRSVRLWSGAGDRSRRCGHLPLPDPVQATARTGIA